MRRLPRYVQEAQTRRHGKRIGGKEKTDGRGGREQRVRRIASGTFQLLCRDRNLFSRQFEQLGKRWSQKVSDADEATYAEKEFKQLLQAPKRDLWTTALGRRLYDLISPVQFGFACGDSAQRSWWRGFVLDAKQDNYPTGYKLLATKTKERATCRLCALPRQLGYRASFADPKTGDELASSSATVGSDCFQKLKAVVDLATAVFHARQWYDASTAKDRTVDAMTKQLHAIVKARDALRDRLATFESRSTAL
jgi:hypothetical protein